MSYKKPFFLKKKMLCIIQSLFIMILFSSTFRDNINLLPPIDSGIRTSFWQFSIFGWCSPVLVLFLSIFLQSKQNGNLLDVSELKPTNCWFLGRNAFLYGFAVPVTMLLLLTVASLIRTAFVIRQSVSIQVKKI